MAAIIKAVAQQMSTEERRKEIWANAMDIFSAVAASVSCILLLQLC